MNEVITNEIEEPKKWKKDEKVSNYMPRKTDKEEPKEELPNLDIAYSWGNELPPPTPGPTDVDPNNEITPPIPSPTEVDPEFTHTNTKLKRSKFRITPPSPEPTDIDPELPPPPPSTEVDPII